MAKASIKPHGEGARPHAPQAGRAVAPRPPQLVRLGEVAPMFVDGDWIESKDQSDRGIRLVQTGNIGVGQYLDKIERAKYISDDTFLRLKCTEIFAGDVLVSRLPDPVGRACVLPDLGQRAITAVDCSILRFDPIRCAARYFVHFTLSKEYASQLSRFLAGSTRIRISRKNLQSIQIPLPPLPEQKRIAAILDKICEMKRNAEARLQKLDILVKARFVEMFGDPLDNPLGFTIVALKELTTKIGSGATPKGGKESYRAEGISLIRSMNVHDGSFKYIDLAHLSDQQAQELTNVTVQSADVLVNITGASVARSCIVPDDVLPARVNQHVAIIRPNDKVLSLYLNRLFINPSYKRLLLGIGESGGATRQAITKQQLEMLRIPLPPLALQRQFAAFVEKVEGLKATAKKELEQVDLLYRAKLQEFFG